MHSPTIASPGPRSGRAQPVMRSPADDVSFGQLLRLARRYRLLIALACACSVAVVTLVSLLLPRTYSTVAQFVPQSRRLQTGNLGGVASQLGISIPGAEPTQSPQFYVDLIASRELLKQVADETYGGRGDPTGRGRRLADWYGVHEADPALRRDRVVARLGRDISARASTTTGVVSVTVRAPDPVLADQIAERVLVLLDLYNREKRQSQAAAERAFTQRRVSEQRAVLHEAEDRLRQFQDANRGLRDAPTLRLTEDRLRQDVLLDQQLYSTLAVSYEQSRIEEVRDTPLLTVVQRPEVAVLPDSRHLVLKVALAAVFGTLLGLTVGFVRAAAPFATADDASSVLNEAGSGGPDPDGSDAGGNGVRGPAHENGRVVTAPSSHPR